jgi:hypothetical protein|tara:strand:- start:1014 stop:1298 length:285 start_codon:yes stop_codon:yes gene_type:complete
MSFSVTTAGILVPVKNRGKENKLIPWSMVKKETIVPAIKHCTNERYGVDLYLVDKTVDGTRFTEAFETKREAFKAVDIFLIQNGREPELILKRV